MLSSCRWHLPYKPRRSLTRILNDVFDSNGYRRRQGALKPPISFELISDRQRSWPLELRHLLQTFTYEVNVLVQSFSSRVIIDLGLNIPKGTQHECHRSARREVS